MSTATHSGQDWGAVAVFAVVYLGMFLGGLPKLKLDRAGVALLGAIAVIGMGALIAVAAVLSAVFSNDVICLAMTPVVARICIRRGINPVPCLVGLACAANIGSAATLIGNPQNMLIGSVLRLSFADYVQHALVPVLLSLGVLWAWLVPVLRRDGAAVVVPTRRTDAGGTTVPASAHQPDDDPPFDRVQTTKGLCVASAVLWAFLLSDWPHEVVALVAAGVLLLSRTFHSSRVMGYVDWELLVLFMGLFVVNRAFEHTGLAAEAVGAMAAQGVHLGDTGPLFAAGLVLSNLVSNVPAVMLLLPHVQGGDPAMVGLTLALVTTFAGNLLWWAPSPT